MFESEFTINRFLLQYARNLIRDVSDERMAEQPLPGVNHPAWILGHLALSADWGVGALGGEKSLPAEWTSHFGAGSMPMTVRTEYPSKSDLLEAVEQHFDRFRQHASTATSEQLAQPWANPATKKALPTIKDAIAFLLTGHPGVHVGQLSTWRRMIGSPRLF